MTARLAIGQVLDVLAVAVPGLGITTQRFSSTSAYIQITRQLDGDLTQNATLHVEVHRGNVPVADLIRAMPTLFVEHGRESARCRNTRRVR